jgi:hypothetical protein
MSKKYKSTQRKSKKKQVIALLLMALLPILVTGAIIISENKKDKAQQTHSNDTSFNPDGMNLDPPTQEEVFETEQFKKNLELNQTTQFSSSEDGRYIVNPIIVSASSIEVSAYIPGVFENEGVCKATFSKGSQVKEFSSVGFGNVSNTTCEPIKVNGLDKGKWSVTVLYESSASKGLSSEFIVELM